MSIVIKNIKIPLKHNRETFINVLGIGFGTMGVKALDDFDTERFLSSVEDNLFCTESDSF